MRKNPYKISTFILSVLLVITLFFYHDATKRPPTVVGSFSYHAAAGNDNVMIALGLFQKNYYRLYFQGKEFDRGTYIETSDNVYMLKPKKGISGTMIITNKEKYLYYPKLKEKVIIVKKNSDDPIILK